MRSSSSLGIVFVALGGLAVSGVGGHRPLGPVPWILAGLLIVAGVLVFTRLRMAFWIALAVGALTAATGVLPYLHHPELALPVPPALSIGIGLYLVLRTALGAATFGARKSGGFVPRDQPPPAEPSR
jgi:hypothetical protein